VQGLRVVSWFGALLLAVAAHASEDAARQWLARMADAGTRLQYSGILVYQHGDRLDALQVQRLIGPNGPRDHLLALTGDGRELVREAGELRCLTPGGSVAVSDKAGWPLRAEHVDPSAFEHYNVTLLDDERVAGRRVVVIEARARDGQRFGYRLLIERESGLLLGSFLVDANGRVLERMMFTQVEIASAPAPVVAAGDSTPATIAAVPPPGVRVTRLPEGFRLVAQLPGTAAGSWQGVYSDGLASFSVYLEVDAAPGFRGAAQRGAVHAFGRRVDATNIVVVGDLPPAVIESIAGSIATSTEPPR
jgi:sigma-E factor negative regulatory protein RseB